MEAKILRLTLTKRWFDMILYGEKKEEYREIKPYWIRRLLVCRAEQEQRGENRSVPENIMFDLRNSHDVNKTFTAYRCYYRKFDYVEFTNGYGKGMPTMRVECKGISAGQPAFKWYGKPTEDVCVYIISLGKVIDISNVYVPARKLALLPGPLRRKYLQLSSGTGDSI